MMPPKKILPVTVKRRKTGKKDVEKTISLNALNVAFEGMKDEITDKISDEELDRWINAPRRKISKKDKRDYGSFAAGINNAINAAKKITKIQRSRKKAKTGPRSKTYRK